MMTTLLDSPRTEKNDQSAESLLSRRYRWSYIIAIGSLAIIALVIIVLFFWAVLPARAFTMAEPITVLTPQVRAGHAVVLQMDYCKAESDIAIVGTLLARPGVVIPLSLWPSDLPVGCHNVAVMLPIPAYVPPQIYTLHMVREYRPSVLGFAGYAAVSQQFQVLPYDGSPPPVPPASVSQGPAPAAVGPLFTERRVGDGRP